MAEAVSVEPNSRPGLSPELSKPNERQLLQKLTLEMVRRSCTLSTARRSAELEGLVLELIEVHNDASCRRLRPAVEVDAAVASLDVPQNLGEVAAKARSHLNSLGGISL